MWNLLSAQFPNHPYLDTSNNAWWHEEISKFIRMSTANAMLNVNEIEERASEPLYRDITGNRIHGNMGLGAEGLVRAQYRGASFSFSESMNNICSIPDVFG